MVFSSDTLTTDIITGFLIIFVSILSTIGGVGGGGILIPLYILLTQIQLEYAIPLAIISILGNTLIRVIFFFNRKRPDTLNKRDLVDMLPVLLIVPFDASTSYFGVLLSIWTPKLMTLIVIILVLTITFYKTLSSTIKLHKNEKRIEINNVQEQMIMIDGIDINLNNKDIETAINMRRDKNKTGDILTLKIMYMVISFFSMVIFGIFALTRNLLNRYSLEYWLQIGGQVLVAVLIGLFMVFIVIRDHQEKIYRNYFFVDGDINWNFKTITSLIIASCLTGVLSTYMGIGGGMIMNPVLIGVLKMNPQVVTATSSITTFFSSMISTLNYISNDQILWDYAIYFFITSMIGSLIGIKISNYLINIIKKQSIMSGILSLIIFISTILLIVNTILDD